MATKCDVDFVAVDGKYGGTGASPDHAIQNMSLPTIAAISMADKALRDAGVREQVTLIALGGFRDGDGAKALALRCRRGSNDHSNRDCSRMHHVRIMLNWRLPCGDMYSETRA